MIRVVSIPVEMGKEIVLLIDGMIGTKISDVPKVEKNIELALNNIMRKWSYAVHLETLTSKTKYCKYTNHLHIDVLDVNGCVVQLVDDLDNGVDKPNFI